MPHRKHHPHPRSLRAGAKRQPSVKGKTAPRRHLRCGAEAPVCCDPANPEKQKLVKRLFGIDIKIPAQLDASKEAKDFLWLSNNATRGMQNLIFLRVNARYEKKAIDSLLRKIWWGKWTTCICSLATPRCYTTT